MVTIGLTLKITPIFTHPTSQNHTPVWQNHTPPEPVGITFLQGYAWKTIRLDLWKSHRYSHMSHLKFTPLCDKITHLLKPLALLSCRVMSEQLFVYILESHTDIHTCHTSNSHPCVTKSHTSRKNTPLWTCWYYLPNEYTLAPYNSISWKSHRFSHPCHTQNHTPCLAQ